MLKLPSLPYLPIIDIDQFEGFFLTTDVDGRLIYVSGLSWSINPTRWAEEERVKFKKESYFVM